MKRCCISIPPQVILDLFTNNRRILDVIKGIDTKAGKVTIKGVSIEPRNGAINVFFEQFTAVELLGDRENLHQVEPQVSLIGVPVDLDKLSRFMLEVTQICIAQLGAPQGEVFSVPDFLRDKIVPFFKPEAQNGGASRVN